MTSIINCTPHALTVAGKTFPPFDGEPIRIHVPPAVDFPTIHGLPVVGLSAPWPEAVQGAAHRIIVRAHEAGADTVIVSRMVLEALASARVVGAEAALKLAVAPDTSPDSAVRDALGQVVGVKRLLAARRRAARVRHLRPLTPKQRRIYDFILEHHAEHGEVPRNRAIEEHTGVKHLTEVMYALSSRGLLIHASHGKWLLTDQRA